MIKIKRGKTKTWESSNPVLEDGQPGYDHEKHKLKIGYNKTPWNELPYATGLFAEEILDTEASAKSRAKKSSTLFTYGKDKPSSSTTGSVYLQQFEGAVEADYVIETGRSSNYFYRKWNSGFIECWGTGSTIPSSLNSKVKTSIFSVKTDNYFEVKGFWN